LSASWTSRVRFEVMTTIGGCLALTVRDGDLEIGQHFEQEGLECLVAAVELVDQKHRRASSIRLQRLEQRPLDQEALGEHVMLDALAIVLPLRLGGANRDHLGRVVPLIDRIGDIEALVALQADQPAPERGRQDFGDLGLADAGFALEEDWPTHLERQEQDSRQRPVGEVVGVSQELQRVVDGRRNRAGFYNLVHAGYLLRHGRACPGHPRFAALHRPKTWMPGTRPGMTPW
jgi:hypothetical protein